MMSPPEVLQGANPRTIAPQTYATWVQLLKTTNCDSIRLECKWVNSPCCCRKVEGPRVPRDERRRAQHNEGQAESLTILAPPHESPSIMVISIMFYLQLRGGDETRSTTGSWRCPSWSRTAAWTADLRRWAVTSAPRFTADVPLTRRLKPLFLVWLFSRVKEASCPKPATTSGSCGRTTSGCRTAARRWSKPRWTTSCSDSRYTPPSLLRSIHGNSINKNFNKC